MVMEARNGVTRQYDRIRRFVVGEYVYEVEYEFIGESLPPIYTVLDAQDGKKLHFHGRTHGQHFQVLLAALDHLEEIGKLPVRVATCSILQIVEV